LTASRSKLKLATKETNRIKKLEIAE